MISRVAKPVLWALIAWGGGKGDSLWAEEYNQTEYGQYTTVIMQVFFNSSATPASQAA